jgi:hypothetical protein
MLTGTLFSTLLAATTTLALPHFLKREDVITTNVTYYQGSSSDPDICGLEAVSSGNITSGICNTAYTWSLTVQPLPERDCQYVLWKGTASCGDESDATEKYFLPAGGHPVCVTTGVYDGGNHVHASGMLDCDVDIN